MKEVSEKQKAFDVLRYVLRYRSESVTGRENDSSDLQLRGWWRSDSNWGAELLVVT